MVSGTKKVVVVDDSRTTLLLIENLLLEIDRNIQIKLFDKASLALKYLKAHNPDLLIIDLFMPGMNGIDLLKKIYPSRDFTIFMISANTKVVKIETALELGIDEYFTKPLKIKNLKEKMLEALKIKKEYQVKEVN